MATPLQIHSVTFWPPPPDDPTDTDRSITIRREGELFHSRKRTARLTLPYDVAHDAGVVPPPVPPWKRQIDPETPVKGWNVLVSCTARHLAGHPDSPWDDNDVPDDEFADPVVVGIGPAMATVYVGEVVSGSDRITHFDRVYDLCCTPPDVRHVS